MSDKINFKYRGREGVSCPKVQVDVLSYEPLHKRIERFLSGDASSLEGVDTNKLEYDEPEKIGEDSSIFEPSDIRDDVLNQPLDNLDIAELKCDSQKSLYEYSKKLEAMKNNQKSQAQSQAKSQSQSQSQSQAQSQVQSQAQSQAQNED